VVRDFRGLAIFLPGVAILLGDTEREVLLRVARTDAEGGSSEPFSGMINLGGVMISMLFLSLLPFSIGSASSSATIHPRMPYSSASLSAGEVLMLECRLV